MFVLLLFPFSLALVFPFLLIHSLTLSFFLQILSEDLPSGLQGALTWVGFGGGLD